jgi:hypothetical protein
VAADSDAVDAVDASALQTVADAVLHEAEDSAAVVAVLHAEMCITHQRAVIGAIEVSPVAGAGARDAIGGTPAADLTVALARRREDGVDMVGETVRLGKAGVEVVLVDEVGGEGVGAGAIIAIPAVTGLIHAVLVGIGVGEDGRWTSANGREPDLGLLD